MIQNKNIRVDSIETKMANSGNTKYIITEGKDKYYFWRLEKGSEGNVFNSFTGMTDAGTLKKGAVVHIGYTEEDESFVNNEGKTINYKSRHIVGLREAGNDATVSDSQPAQNSRPGANSRPTESPRESSAAFGQRLAIHGMVNGMLAAGREPQVVIDSLGELLKLEDAIDTALKSPSDYLSDDLPTIHTDDNDESISVEDIPF